MNECLNIVDMLDTYKHIAETDENFTLSRKSTLELFEYIDKLKNCENCKQGMNRLRYDDNYYPCVLCENTEKWIWQFAKEQESGADDE